MKRRDALLSLAMSVAVAAVSSWPAPARANQGLSEEQLGTLLGQMVGLELRPGEAPKVLASIRLNRFTRRVEPTIQPHDFDPELDL